MEIDDNLEIIDLSLFFRREKILVVTDFHIGIEEAMNKQGFLVPRFQVKEMRKRLRKILDKTKPDKIIILGDLKHEFGRISSQEWHDTLEMIELMTGYTDDLVLLKGNHDTILGPIAEKKEIKLKDHYYLHGNYFCHGDKIPENKDFNDAERIIVGHEHPAISIRNEYRAERYKCFLQGSFRDKKFVLVPSFSEVSEGTDILKDSILSPFLKEIDVEKLNVFVVADEVYYFGTVKQVRSAY